MEWQGLVSQQSKMKSKYKISACFCCHDNDSSIKMVLDSISKYVNHGIFVNLNDPTDKMKEIVNDHKAVTNVIETTNNGQRWNQGLVRDNTIRMLDNANPDIVLFLDDDETLPDIYDFPGQLEQFMSNEDYRTWWWRLLYLHGDKYHFRNDGLYKSIHHVRAYKWEPGITYLPKYPGYACPRNFAKLDKKARFNADRPMLHWGYMNEDDRLRKYKRGNCRQCDEEYRKEVDKGMLILETPKELL